MNVPFTKASACGNDFLIIQTRYAPADLHAFTRAICDRHNGVGADGVEWLEPWQDADIAIRLINADGSEAEISGNGTRCVAAHLVASGSKSPLRIQTGAGLKLCELISQNGQRFEFETTMGKPEVGKPISVKIRVGEISGTPVSMGNPHLVVFAKEFAPSWQEEAAQIQQQKMFSKDGVNVEFVQILARDRIDVRFFERGVGETQSSGTGSCASGVAAIAAGQVKSPVKVHAPGGTQEVLWEGADVLLRGPAQIICQGEFFG
jgi:diaminopimelate epimerase